MSISSYDHSGNGTGPADGLSINGFDGVSICTDNSTGRTERLRVTQAGLVGIGTASPARQLSVTTATSDDGIVLTNSSANGGRLRLESTGTGGRAYHIVSTADGSGAGGGKFVIFDNTASDTARLVIDSSGRLLIGTSTSSGSNHSFQVRNDGGANVELFTSSATADIGPYLNFSRSRGTAAAPTVVAQNDRLSALYFSGYSGAASAYRPAAIIAAFVDGEPDTAGDTTDMPGRLSFSTSADGTSSPTEKMRISNAGTTTLTSAASTAPFIVNISASEVARIDSSGRLLVGTSTARTNFYNSTNSSTVLVENTGAFTATAAFIRNNSDTGGGEIILAKTKSSATGGIAAVVSGDALGGVIFQGSDGTEFVDGARIMVTVDGTPGANNMPGRIVLSTTPDGTATSVERFRITNDGVIAHDQPAPAAVNATATLTAANLKAGIITSTSAAATDMTLPTGTDTEGGFATGSLYTNFTFEWSVINTGPSLVRVLAGTAHIVVGSGSVATGTSGRFATRRTAANTFTSYRLS
jgi:hypothetical protein